MKLSTRNLRICYKREANTVISMKQVHINITTVGHKHSSQEPARKMTAIWQLQGWKPCPSRVGCGFKSPRLHQSNKKRRPRTSFFVPGIQSNQAPSTIKQAIPITSAQPTPYAPLSHFSSPQSPAHTLPHRKNCPTWQWRSCRYRSRSNSSRLVLR